MRRYFGTDGVRGTVNQSPMTAEFALTLGRAAGHVLTRHLKHKPHILIGKDTRLSGYMIESALCAGLTAQGMNVLLVGPVPTPAVAYLTRSLRADAGVMLSASHNPAGDNGIKFFAADGFKLPDEIELEIEQCIDALPPLPPALEVGKASRVDDARGRYIEFLKAALPRGMRFDGLKVVIDCANGAAYDVAPRILRELGCDVIAMAASPDGYNINKGCGSTHPEGMTARVVETGADIGLALDGDADRLIACDANGDIVDGDRVIAILAEHAASQGRLQGGAVVTTLMSNMGLERYLAGLGLDMHRASVGDRYVLEMMNELGCNIGGEQSGHMILLDYNTTGDGLMSGLQLLAAMSQQEKPLAELAAGMNLFPQKLWNIVMPERRDVLADAAVASLIAQAESRLAGNGRINVRMSGTEPKLRIMVEAEDEALMLDIGDSLTREISTIVC
ncbi:phosphoglucosamine mutase [Mariprofundus erugo]|uniref:Phosphoglucosamine mutase n=1 Tax=Mariprofundus erugo TaxID=2528639 RepID=A0A5R9GV69_9PROT|nr:phosphoglucosamine mutase [Mariprofundus erugo]TLS68699.1 phosphoglucosamine mutase [Mariprofundus erugo]TLS77608.1 phosphoglucosamine mutase [Mariprofundus erugo]